MSIRFCNVTDGHDFKFCKVKLVSPSTYNKDEILDFYIDLYKCNKCDCLINRINMTDYYLKDCGTFICEELIIKNIIE